MKVIAYIFKYNKNDYRLWPCNININEKVPMNDDNEPHGLVDEEDLDD